MTLELSPEKREGGSHVTLEGTAVQRPVEKISWCIPELSSRKREEKSAYRPRAERTCWTPLDNPIWNHSQLCSMNYRGESDRKTEQRKIQPQTRECEQPPETREHREQILS